jgi:D-alanine--poly(phosphoribitol) ligase subunit 2
MRQAMLNTILHVSNRISSTLDCPLQTEKGEQCLLYHKGSTLDSIGLVTLIASLEQAIEETFAIPIILANEKALSQRHSPFATIGTLTDYATSLVKEAQHD